MRLAFVLPLVVCAIGLAGCSGKTSNLDAKNPAGQIVYPITAEEADRVVSQAMVATFPDTPIVPVAVPNKGYTVTIQFLMDSHRITATAVPATGQEPNGLKVSGYAFDVSDYGTIPLTASRKVASLFDALNQSAAAIKGPLPLASR
jgi:hypothetical protein